MNEVKVLKPVDSVAVMGDLMEAAKLNLGKLFHELAIDVMQNFPEYCRGYGWYRCVDWSGYNQPGATEEGYALKFKVADRDSDSDEPVLDVTVTTKEFAERGIPMLYFSILAGKFPGLRHFGMNNFFDAGDWDADVIDVAMQLHMFGDYIFG